MKKLQLIMQAQQWSSDQETSQASYAFKILHMTAKNGYKCMPISI